jgi:hypothetical protein
MKEASESLAASLLATFTLCSLTFDEWSCSSAAGAGLAGGSLAVRLTAYRPYLFPVSVLALAAGSIGPTQRG